MLLKSSHLNTPFAAIAVVIGTVSTAFLDGAEPSAPAAPVVKSWQAPSGGEWRKALPGWEYQFPRDHFAHPDFQTEWWYFTGNLRAKTDPQERYGFQVTLFRQGVIPPGDWQDAEPKSRWLKSSFYFAHLALSDLKRKKHYREQKVARGVFGEAGNELYTPSPDNPGQNQERTARLAWIEDWEVRAVYRDSISLEGGNALIRYETTGRMEDGTELQLRLTPTQRPIFHGKDGVSQKAAGKGRASHYYSWCRLKVEGTVQPGDQSEPIQVEGEGWFDQEWATNQLGENQAGWDWFSLQLDDGSELMIYQMRLADGGVDPASKGTFVSPEVDSQMVTFQEYTLTPAKPWLSPETGGAYPQEWRVEIPKLELDLTVRTTFPEQEMDFPPVAYWEGAVILEGSRAGKPVAGRGYMELTGYAEALTPLRGGE